MHSSYCATCALGKLPISDMFNYAYIYGCIYVYLSINKHIDLPNIRLGGGEVGNGKGGLLDVLLASAGEPAGRPRQAVWAS